jgi:hypothetical protein
MKIVKTALFALALGAAACSGAAQSSSGGSTTGGAQSGAVAAAAAQLGVNEKYVTMAVDAAQSAFGTGPKTADDKATAAQAGVDKAAAQAQTDGTPLTADQKTGLVDTIKNLL